jgi:hypothetical protein
MTQEDSDAGRSISFFEANNGQRSWILRRAVAYSAGLGGQCYDLLQKNANLLKSNAMSIRCVSAYKFIDSIYL